MEQNPTGPEKPDDKNRKPNWRQKLSAAFNGVSRKDAGRILASTLRDLRKPKEIGILALSSFLPGGWVGYAAYRVTKYKLQKPPANDDTPKPPPGKNPKPPAPPKP